MQRSKRRKLYIGSGSAARAETVYIPNSQKEREQAGIEDIDIKQAIDYYKTPRRQKPGSPHKVPAASMIAAFAFDAFHLTEHLLTRPLQIIAGSVPGARLLPRCLCAL